MTGTAATESTEFESIYKLKVTIVPTNKPMIRKVTSRSYHAIHRKHIYSADGCHCDADCKTRLPKYGG